MKIRITKHTYSHHTNQEYKCVIVSFEPTDTSFFSKEDWMPKDDEVLAIVRAMIERSDTFEPKLRKLISQRKLFFVPLQTDKEYYVNEIVD